jgi:hypothetical protein
MLERAKVETEREEFQKRKTEGVRKENSSL